MTSILWIYFLVKLIPIRELRELVLAYYWFSVAVTVSTIVAIIVLDKLS